MFGYNDFSMDFLTSSPVLVWLALLALAGFAIFTYYRTNPPLPKYLRIILGTLRVMAIAALFLALLEPVISFSRQYERARKISVMIDRSDSMERVEKEKSRRSAEFDAWLEKFRGTATSGLTTDEIMRMTRGYGDDSDPGRF